MERPTRLPQTLSEYVEHWWTGTQADLAKRFNISQGHLSALISGNRQASRTLAITINGITGIPIESLIQRKPDVVEGAAPAGDGDPVPAIAGTSVAQQ